MRHLRLALMGFLLVLPLGCGGKSEEAKSPDKTENAAANNNQGNNAPTGRVGSEHAMIPNGTIALYHVRPAAALASPLAKSLPEQEKQLAGIKDTVGFELTSVASVSIALWPGDGHVIPTLPERLLPQGEQGPPTSSDPVPETPDSDDGASGNSDPSLDPTDCSYQQPGGLNPQMFLPQLDELFENLPKLDGAVIIRFTKAMDLKTLKEKNQQLSVLQEQTIENRPALIFPGFRVGGGPVLFQADPQTLVITFKDDVADIVKSTGESKLAGQVKAQGSDVDVAFLLDFSPFSDLITKAAEGAQGPPGANEAANSLTGFSFFIDINDGVDVDVMIDAKDAETIASIKEQFDANAPAAKGLLPNLADELPPGISEEDKAQIQQASEAVVDSLKGEAEGTRFHLSFRLPETLGEILTKLNEAENR